MDTFLFKYSKSDKDRNKNFSIPRKGWINQPVLKFSVD